MEALSSLPGGGLVSALAAGVYDAVFAAPAYHLLVEVLLLAYILYLFLNKSYRPRDKLTEKEKDELIAEWEPEPLVPATPPDHHALHPRWVEGKMGKFVTVEGKSCLNMATLNFLGFIGEERIEAAAEAAIDKYGVGSCGPRAFYGTTEAHLELEEELATFLGCEETVLYSYGFATIASAIPAYAKVGDVIFADKAVNFPIQKGLQASKSRIEWFEHNDTEDLERLLLLQADRDRKNPKKAKVTRRFIVVESLYLNTGLLCPLPKLLELKWKYKVRLFVDDSLGLGVLGSGGRGVVEHFGVNMEEVDLVMGTLEAAIGSIGGYAAGRSFVVDHQRLSGSGYCFSASQPPLLAVAATKALRILQEEPERVARLRQNSALLSGALAEALAESDFYLEGWEGSPVYHLRPKLHLSAEAAEARLDAIVAAAYADAIVLTRSRHLVSQEAWPLRPSIRIAVSAHLSAEELRDVAAKIGRYARL